MDYAKKILKDLVAKYEKSKSFTGGNKVTQSFALAPGKLIKKYNDHSDYKVFESVNDAVRELETLGYVTAIRQVKVVEKVQLIVDNLEDIYGYIGQVPKKLVNEKLALLFDQYYGKHRVVDGYIEVQRIKVTKNQKVQGYNGDLEEYEDLLKVLIALFQLRSETYERDFSVRLFGDSKRFKALEARVIAIIYEYGDYPDKSSVLGELNLLKNPTYVYVKGQGSISFASQSIDLSELPSDIAISSENLEEITSIKVLGDGVITVENLTSFHTFPSDKMLVVYLGGFHNGVRRAFLKQIEEDNKRAKFYHFGDIDIGGILIYEHLRRKTEIAFEPYEMTISNLERYKERAQPLTDNDRKRAEKLMGGPWREVVTYMLKNNCKLEQEAIEL